MPGRRVLATIAAAILLFQHIAGSAAAQYATGLPQGIVAAEVDGQPIDAVNSPKTGSDSPTIGGRINTGQPTVEIGIGNGDIQRFQAEADAKGRFKAKPPAPLAPGLYSLYLFDALVGNFEITGDGGPQDADRETRKGPTTDVARLVPFPGDFYGIYPELGLLDGRYYTADQEAIRAASGTGEATEDAIAQARADLRDAGWVQRYESRLAVPDPNDRARFAVQANSFVIEYKDEASAQAAFGASLTGADLRPDVAVGAQSELTQLQGTTPDTGAGYLGLRNVFQVGRFVCVTVLADLTGGEPSQDAILSAALAVAARAAQVEAGEVSGAAPKSLRIDLPGGAAATYDESYQAIDGQLVPLYDESRKGLSAREAAFTGTYEDYVGGFTGMTGGDNPVEFAYGSTISSFPGPAEADAWMTALPDLIASDPLPGYESFDPMSNAPTAGEASTTYAVSRKIDKAVLSGFRVYARVGADVATLEFASSEPPTLDDLGPLIEAQVACLESGACDESASLPGAKASKDDKPKAETEPATSAETTEAGVTEIGSQPAGDSPDATAESAIRPAAPQSEKTPQAAPENAGTPTAEPAVRRASSPGDADKKEKEKKNRGDSTPAPAATAQPAPEPTPTWGGGVRDVTPNPTVTGG